MDIKKTGAFLKLLRKEKGLTQEQLAEKLSVTSRTVSRWETGTNLPDIDLIVILADFYEVDIKEIIDGERKMQRAENPQQALKSLADYGVEKEKQLLKKSVLITVSGLVAWCLSLCVMLNFLDGVKEGGLILVFTIVAFVLYCACVFLNKANRNIKECLNAFAGAFCAVITSNILLTAVFFGSGTYINRGLSGVYYSLGIIVFVFLLSAAIVTLINKKK